MTKQVQRRRGTSTQHTGFTGADGEISVNTTNKSVHVHDGSTAGGFEAARADLNNVTGSDVASSVSGETVSSLTITSADINGGSIDGTTIGGSTPAAGSFTSVSVTGTVDGRDVAADGAKLDGIEASADVTDTANVTAAGALMDSELTDIAAVKALDQGVATTDSPSFAGLTATSADINGGTIDGVTIGGASAGAGSFTTLSNTSNATLQNLSSTNSPLNISSSASDASATLDASGNLLVGKTSADVSVQGAELRETGFSSFTRDTSNSGQSVFLLNKKNNDGVIQVFQKDSSTVGEIGANSGSLFIASPYGTDSGLRIGNSNVSPATTAGAARDAAIDLGYDTNRFKDLYLSGGVYVGGTVAANYLDDYEEGTWTPNIGGNGNDTDGGTGNVYSTQVGRYTKVGNIVHAYCNVALSTASGNSGIVIFINGWPFNPVNATSVNFRLPSLHWNNLGTSYVNVAGYFNVGENRLHIIGNTAANSNGGSFISTGFLENNTGFVCMFTYETA